MSGRDREFLHMLEKFGAKITRRSNGFYIRGPQRLKGAKIDLSQAPELLPWVAVLACRGKGRTEIRDAGRARTMKSDRIAAIKEGLQRMGAKIQEYRDGLVIHGPTEFRGAQVDGHADYAVISALAVAGFLAKKETLIKNRAEALRTSYPRLISSFKELGLDISTKP
jgi:3-phosphoshikimate 1-carboxyvinyltransferase